MQNEQWSMASWCRLAGIAGLCAATVPGGRAQESIRPSLTGATAAEVRKPSFRAQPSYNLKAGPVVFDLRGEFGVEFNDNINLSTDNPQPDVILRPRVTVNAFWQLTPLNALRLDLGFGYAKYLNNQDLDSNTLLLTPNSQVSFDLFIGDFRVNLHDRFSLREDPTDEIGLSNVAQFLRFENVIGFSVLWDLNDIKLVFGYDHYDFKAISSQFGYLDRAEEQLTLSAAFLLTDATTAGLDLGGAFVTYDETRNSDAVLLQAGPFLETQLSNYLKLRLAGGYQSIRFASSDDGAGRDALGGPFANLALANRLNQYLNHVLTVGYETRLGLTTESEQLAYLRYGLRWRMNRLITITGEGFCESSSQTAGIDTEDAIRYGAGLGTGYQLAPKMVVGLRYQFSVKNSALAGRDYYQNRVSIQFDYDF